MKNWTALLRNRNFALLWFAMLISATGTFFLLLAISLFFLRAHNSGLGAASVFAFQWVLPVLLPQVILRICNGLGLRRSIVSSELASACLSLGVGLFLKHDLLALVIVSFLLRGLFESITKVTRVALVKVLFQGPQLELASSTFNMSYYLGMVLGGILGSLLVGRFSLLSVCAIDAATFVVSAGLYGLLPKVELPPRVGVSRSGIFVSAFRIASKNPRLLKSLAYLILSVGFFQGFHYAARTILPVRQLHLSDQAAMYLQVITGAAIILGAMAVSLFPVLARKDRVGFALNLSTAALMVAATLSRGSTQLLVLYFGFIFLFEVAFTASQSSMIQTSHSEDILTLTTATNALGTGILILCALATGWLADFISIARVGTGVAVVAVLVAMGVEGLGLAKANWAGSALASDGGSE